MDSDTVCSETIIATTKCNVKHSKPVSRTVAILDVHTARQQHHYVRQPPPFQPPPRLMQSLRMPLYRHLKEAFGAVCA